MASWLRFGASKNNGYDSADKFRKHQSQNENRDGYATVLGLKFVNSVCGVRNLIASANMKSKR